MLNKKMLKKQKGQALLIGVMLMAVLLTVVFSASFTSHTDTQIAKLEEENQKTLAAAEAGIEAALKKGTIADLSTLNIPAGFTGSATVSTLASSCFITPFISKDSQYTFYLSAPGGTSNNPDFSSLTSSYNNSSLTICSTSSSFAVSIYLLKANGVAKRFAINPPVANIITNGLTANNLGDCPTGQTFAYRHLLYASDVGLNNMLLFIRLVGSGTGAQLAIVGGSTLPLQGKTITSKASSPTGVTKTVQLFQSYPQIPAEFFTTSF